MVGWPSHPTRARAPDRSAINVAAPDPARDQRDRGTVDQRTLEPGERRLPVLPDQAAGAEQGAVRAGCARLRPGRDDAGVGARGPPARSSQARAEVLRDGCADAGGPAGQPFRPADGIRRCRGSWRRRTGLGSRIVLRQCPKTSRLMTPTTVVQAWTASTTFLAGMPGNSPSATGATAARARVRRACGRSTEAARRLGRDDRPHHGRGDPGIGHDRLLGRLVARNRRPEDKAPLVWVHQGPDAAWRGARRASARRRRLPRLWAAPPRRPPVPPRSASDS